MVPHGLLCGAAKPETSRSYGLYPIGSWTRGSQELVRTQCKPPATRTLSLNIVYVTVMEWCNIRCNRPTNKTTTFKQQHWHLYCLQSLLSIPIPLMKLPLAHQPYLLS